MKKRTVLVILGGGGHTAQMRHLVRRLGSRYRYEYVLSYDNPCTPKGARHYRVLNPRSMSDRNPFWVACKTLVCAAQAAGVLLKSDSSVIVACGPAISVPFCLIGKLFRKKIIYVETWARVKTISKSGRIVYPFADLFFVQWPALRRLLPRAQYLGRLA
jgi:UDP-N-acetylglucosamine:LPS N-acetylglucosamine transferase